ncbi:hypothetical protein DFP72DRAFT_1173260 [Ephemerocybe angulata]|uniref:Uncharacterized protein n=1 Tax=Ephemerocybe angulata TaxID=980116 RepID=A0A8H6M0M0_9AGAR|nr:hypothetical protein DFP72DRAFT_1173260 [Tulosesus angulatus]
MLAPTSEVSNANVTNMENEGAAPVQQNPEAPVGPAVKVYDDANSYSNGSCHSNPIGDDTVVENHDTSDSTEYDERIEKHFMSGDPEIMKYLFIDYFTQQVTTEQDAKKYYRYLAQLKCRA